MKLILFDIDGTLVRGGPAKEAFRVSMLETFGTAGEVSDFDFSGKTDPQIARELLQAAAVSEPEIERGFPALWTRYLGELARRLPENPVEVLPGISTLLAALEASGEAALGLVTGNLARGATLKLGSAGLEGRFQVGGFGSDDEVRNHLPAVAIRRARKAWGRSFAAAAVVVVGDTPRDVACGRHQGCRTVAVATGRFGLGALEACRPDYAFPDLSALDPVLDALLGVRGPQQRQG